MVSKHYLALYTQLTASATVPTAQYEAENIMKCRDLSPSRASFPLARQWLQLCKCHHRSTCTPLQYEANSISPKRSFFLRVIDTWEERIVSAPGGCKYAALSYVWGQAVQLKLTKDNYEQLTKRGAISDNSERIPMTIRDAMVVCKELNIRYLWVDSLCIIQDCKDDRETQIECMGFIYGGAFVTIAAVSGNDANAGLPGVRETHRQVTQESALIGDLDVALVQADAIHAFMKAPWNLRGWTFQEFILSKRILAFTESQMMFICARKYFFESTVLEDHNGTLCYLDNLGFLPQGNLNYDSYRPEELRISDVNDATEIYKQWADAYIHRSFTDDSDILDGFHGLHQCLHSRLGPARWGLLDAQLEYMLLWYSNDMFPLPRRKGVPSWTWMGWKQFQSQLEFVKSPNERFMYRPDWMPTPEPIPLFELKDLKDTTTLTRISGIYDLDNICAQLLSSAHRNAILRSLADTVLELRPDDEYNKYKYLFFQTECTSCAVDLEPSKFIPQDLEASGSSIGFAIRDRYGLSLGHVQLDPQWRAERGKQLDFIVILRSSWQLVLMLVEWSGAIACRVQLVKDINPMDWDVLESESRLVVLA